MPAGKLGVGFVGTGWMGTALLGVLCKRDDVEIVSLLSRDQGRGRQLLDSLGQTNAAVTGDFDQLLADPRVKSVWLCNPNSLHGPQSIAAMHLGKHVFCEKPAATSFIDFQTQVQLQAKHPELATYVDYILYFDSMEQWLRQSVQRGTFGKVTQLQVNYRHPVNIAGSKAWKLDESMMGDAVSMAIVHSISVMVLAMASQARPVEVFAMSQRASVRPFQADPVWNILIRFDDGACGFCAGNIDNGNGYDAFHSVYGTEGAFVYDSGQDRPQKVRYWSSGETAGHWVYPLDPKRCVDAGRAALAWPADSTTPDSGNVIDHQLGSAVEHFVNAVQTGEESPLSFRKSAPIAEAGWAAVLSAATNKPVQLPLTAECVAALTSMSRSKREQL